MKNNRLIFPAWYGEFGWELMTWQAKCRLIAHLMGLKKEHVLIRSFPGMAPLYEDFAMFEAHDFPGRTDSFQKYGLPKQYRINGKWIRYGSLKEPSFTYLFHARGGGRGKNTAFSTWGEIVRDIPHPSACIGTMDDLLLPDMTDLRGINLSSLMDYMASAVKVIGQSSGPMHLAALCGANLVVWGDARTYFNETLEKRYKETWNPFHVHVDFVFTGNNWQPDPEKLRSLL